MANEPVRRNPGSEPARIQNPLNLLEEALKRMSPRKRQELLDKAADEALRIQVKRKEHEGDREAVADKIREAGRFVDGIAGKSGVSGTYASEQRSPFGDTKITVSSRGGFCFVATACFRDYDHSTVVELRRFRDLVLMESALGRGFVSVYYRYGPVLARWVNRLPALKPAIRCALSVFVSIHPWWKTVERKR
jgi:hypothetical protein